MNAYIARVLAEQQAITDAWQVAEAFLSAVQARRCFSLIRRRTEAV